MELTTAQTDAISELINIGHGRAAAALSELTSERIQLQVPKIVMRSIDEIAPMLTTMIQGEIASVNQVFSGPIAGTALLMMDEPSALALSQLLNEEGSQPDTFDAGSQEIFTEVGNILLNACLSVFGNLLQVRVTFAVPRLQVANVGNILKSVLVGAEPLQFGLMIQTHFYLKASEVTGYLVIVLGISSLDRMLGELEKWESRQTA